MEQQQPGRVGRRLAAIVAADVAGYSRLMCLDEVGTARTLREHRKVTDALVTKHGGRLVKTTGDGVLLEFPSVVDAVECAMAVQAVMFERNTGIPEDQRMLYRIGINLGDILIEGDDILGDGVNVAARLEGIAEPGGIYVSSSAYEQVRGKVPVDFADLGEQRLKNIDRPVRVYAAKTRDHFGIGVPVVSTSARDTKRPLPQPDKPSIAVLPFQNMSGDQEQEYFVDGIAEDVLTTLSKVPELMVIARNSSFAFKGQTKDMREIGRELGARYVLEGSVRKAGNRVRLTAQLIDSADGSHRWADRFDGGLDDVFDLQDRITQDIVTALEVQLTGDEQARVWRKRSGSPLVYEHFLKGRRLYKNFAKHTHAQARVQFELGLEINPAFAPMLYMLGLTLTDQARFGWEKDRVAAYEAALDCATRALMVDPNSGEAYLVIGYVRTFQRRHDEAVAAGEKALALSPSGADAYHMAGMYHGYAGNFREAALYEERAQLLSPLNLNVSMADEARARFHLGDFTSTRDIALRVLTEKPSWLTAHSTLVAALWNLNRKEEARIVAKELLDRHPGFSVARWAQSLPYRHQEHLDALITPLRLAGLPE
jgi:TolB-like protein/class 3 adenylate cyclase/tetratricopeptide (TPR) repeat protein